MFGKIQTFLFFEGIGNVVHPAQQTGLPFFSNTAFKQRLNKNLTVPLDHVFDFVDTEFRTSDF